MGFLKQLALGLVVVAAAGVAWVRLDRGYDARMAGLGVPAPVIAALTAASDALPFAGRGDAEGGSNGGQSREPGRGGFGDPLVVTAPVETATINNRVTAIGDGEAARSVVVVPLSSGILTEVRVAAGHRVGAGDVLAVLDSEAEEIERDRAALAVETAADTLERYERLVGSRAITEVQLKDARTALQNARLALREAENELRRRTVFAPIDGVVGIVPVEAGDYVTPQTEITTIDDRSRILVDFWAPERFADIVAVGQDVQLDPIALPGETFPGVVVAIGSRIDRDSRTLQIRAEAPNEGDRLRPGMSFRVAMRFAGQDFPAVNPLALQWSSDGPFVWRIEDGKAAKVAVRIVQRNSDRILLDGPIAPGDQVVIEGVQSVRQGGEVRIVGADGQGGS